MAMQGPPPPAKGMNPQDYFNTLVSQGMRPYDAYQAVQANFGKPKTPQQQAEDQASAEQNAAIGQTVGMIGGLIGTRYVLNNAGKWIDKLTGKPASSDVVNAIQQTPQATAPVAATPQANAQWNAAADLASQKTVAVDTPAGKQQVPESLANDTQFLSGVNWNAVANGSVSLLQAYQAYQAYKSGDKVGAGVAGAGAITSGAAAATSAGAGGSTAATIGAWAPYAGIAAGAYGGYQTAQMLGDTAAGSKRTQQGVVGGTTSGAALGAGIGSIVPGVGTAIGAGIGAVVGGLAGAVGSWTGSKKGKAQFMRDNIRGVLQEGGILDNKYQGTLADGTKYDFGKDGSTLKWKNIDKLAAENPSSWNAAVPLTDALATAYGFVGQKASDISAWYAKGAVSNANNDPSVAIKNAQHFAQQQGITYDQIKTKLDEAIADNRISKSQYDYYIGGAQQLTANMPKQPAPAVTPKPPAPIAPNTQATLTQPQSKSGKQSIGDVLRRFANTK